MTEYDFETEYEADLPEGYEVVTHEDIHNAAQEFIDTRLDELDAETSAEDQAFYTELAAVEQNYGGPLTKKDWKELNAYVDSHPDSDELSLQELVDATIGKRDLGNDETRVDALAAMIEDDEE